jgi:hypothetical protein
MKKQNIPKSIFGAKEGVQQHCGKGLTGSFLLSGGGRQFFIKFIPVASAIPPEAVWEISEGS